MVNDIEEIASVHLGKAGDGSIVKPYITPDTIDPSLLVGIPRHLNRVQYNIDSVDLPFTGYDTWNCYEFSTLTTNGYPVSGVVRIVYPTESKNIVESKSLKLYLNSFNMHKSGSTYSEAVEFIQNKIIQDLSPVLCTDELEVVFHNSSSETISPFWSVKFDDLEDIVDIDNIEFNHYNESPDILQVVPSEFSDKYYFLHSSALRSNCRVTNQPDWGDVYIIINGEKTITPESLLQYIVSMRKENHFHEEICECIFKRLDDLLDPRELLVACLYTRRGGIDINPVRSKYWGTAGKFASRLFDSSVLNKKTLRQ